MTTKQKINEQTDNFVKDLRILADTCEYGLLKDSKIKGAFVLGIKYIKLRENFLKEDGLTLERAMQMARANGKARERAAVIMSQKDLEVLEVDKVQKSHDFRQLIKDCGYCGKDHVLESAENAETAVVQTTLQ